MFSLLSPWVLSLSLLPRLPPPLPPGPPPSAAAIAQGGRLAPPAMLLAPVVMGEGTGSELAFYSLPVPLDKVLVNLEGRASEHPLAAAVEEDACALLGAAGLDDGEQLSLTLCDDDMIRDLNSEWRSVDRPTDVLSFPMDDEQLLGDLVVSVETASRQAIDRSHTLRDELRVSRCALRPPPSALRPPPSALRRGLRSGTHSCFAPLPVHCLSSHAHPIAPPPGRFSWCMACCTCSATTTRRVTTPTSKWPPLSASCLAGSAGGGKASSTPSERSPPERSSACRRCPGTRRARGGISHPPPAASPIRPLRCLPLALCVVFTAPSSWMGNLPPCLAPCCRALAACLGRRAWLLRRHILALVAHSRPSLRSLVVSAPPESAIRAPAPCVHSLPLPDQVGAWPCCGRAYLRLYIVPLCWRV